MNAIAEQEQQLTAREIQILMEKARHGLSTSSVARKLKISEKTVKVHLNTIHSKLKAKTTAQALYNYLLREAAHKQ